LSSKCCMAFIPLGVAALPSPSMLDAMFMAMYLLASGLFDLNKVTNFLKDEAKKRGYSSMMLAFAGPETMMENALDVVFGARNLKTPDLSIAKKKDNFVFTKNIITAFHKNNI